MNGLIVAEVSIADAFAFGAYPRLTRMDITGRRSTSSSSARESSIDDALGRLPAAVLFARLPVPLLAADDTGIVAHANAAMAAVLGCASYRLEGRRVGDIVDELRHATVDVLAAMRRLAGSTVTLRTSDGGAAVARLTVVLLDDDDGRFAVAVFADR